MGKTSRAADSIGGPIDVVVIRENGFNERFRGRSEKELGLEMLPDEVPHCNLASSCKVGGVRVWVSCGEFLDQ